MAGRIEAGSYACAAAITGGEVELAGAQSESMEAVLDGLRRAGVVVEEVGGGLLVKADGGLRGVNLSTAPFPDFPTDMPRSEAHTSELQSLMRISYAVLCLNTNTAHL